MHHCYIFIAYAILLLLKTKYHFSRYAFKFLYCPWIFC